MCERISHLTFVNPFHFDGIFCRAYVRAHNIKAIHSNWNKKTTTTKAAKHSSTKWSDKYFQTNFRLNGEKHYIFLLSASHTRTKNMRNNSYQNFANPNCFWQTEWDFLFLQLDKNSKSLEQKKKTNFFFYSIVPTLIIIWREKETKSNFMKTMRAQKQRQPTLKQKLF